MNDNQPYECKAMQEDLWHAIEQDPELLLKLDDAIDSMFRLGNGLLRREPTLSRWALLIPVILSLASL